MPIDDDQMDKVREAFGGYFKYIEDFIDDNKVKIIEVVTDNKSDNNREVEAV